MAVFSSYVGVSALQLFKRRKARKPSGKQLQTMPVPLQVPVKISPDPVLQFTQMLPVLPQPVFGAQVPESLLKPPDPFPVLPYFFGHGKMHPAFLF